MFSGLMSWMENFLVQGKVNLWKKVTTCEKGEKWTGVKYTTVKMILSEKWLKLHINHEEWEMVESDYTHQSWGVIRLIISSRYVSYWLDCRIVSIVQLGQLAKLNTIVFVIWTVGVLSKLCWIERNFLGLNGIGLNGIF